MDAFCIRRGLSEKKTDEEIASECEVTVEVVQRIREEEALKTIEEA